MWLRSVLTLRTRTPVSALSPTASSTTESQTISTFGFSSSRFCMMREARSSSRRWTTKTLEPNLVRCVASSTAESPPPTTNSTLLRR